MAEHGFRLVVEVLVGTGVIAGALVWAYKCARKVNQVMDFLAAAMKPNGGESLYDRVTQLQDQLTGVTDQVTAVVEITASSAATAEVNKEKLDAVIERLDTHIAHHGD